MVDYSDSQQQIIDFEEGDLQVIACAGSGKTDVITRRIAKLITKGLASPGEIVAFTFTEKAAEEMKFRIRKHLQELRPENPEIGEMYIGTIHSFCFDLLREIKPEYRAYDVLDQHKRIALLSDYSNYYKVHLSEIDDRSYGNIAKFCQSVDLVREEMISKEDLPSDFLECYENYLALLDEENYLDFSEMISRTVDLLNNDEEFRNIVQNRYEFIVVDEYQDVNPLQEELIQLISEKENVCVVGDDDQCIYQWRGTSVDNILEFTGRYPDVTQIRIDTNYRSTEAIVESARKFIENNPSRLEKSIEFWDEGNCNYEEGDIYSLFLNNQNDEINFILDKIEELRGTKFTNNKGEEYSLDYRDMVIFFRSVKTSAEPYLDALEERGIDYIVRGGGKLFEENEIKLAIESLAYLAGYDYGGNEVDEDRLISLYERCFGERGDPIEFIKSMERKKEGLDEDTFIDLQEIYQLILKYIGVGQIELQESEYYNFGKVSQAITDYQYIHRKFKLSKMKYFLGFLKGYGEDKYELDIEDDPTKINAVKVMTLHRAKGLEFPIVFMPNLINRRFPPDAPDREWYVPRNLFDYERYNGTIEDERRLFYVGLTRSQKYLFLSGSRSLIGKPSDRKPSMFLDEYPKDYALTSLVEDPTDREEMELSERRGLKEFPTSYSELRYFDRCPYDYKMRHVFGFNPGISLALGYGKSIHNILNIIHENYRENPPSEEEIKELTDQNFFLRFAPMREYNVFKQSAEKVVKNYVKDYAGDLNLVLENEKDFEFAMGESALISGSIDLIKSLDEEGDVEGIEIVDFKNKKNSEKATDYEKQLKLYAIASQKVLEWSPEKATVHHLDDGVKDEVDISEEELTKVEQEVDQTINLIRNGNFEKDESYNKCKKCDWKYICSGWRKVK